MLDMKNITPKGYQNDDETSHPINWTEKLQSYAYWYIGRYACSSAKLADKLRQRAKRLDLSLDRYAVHLPVHIETSIQAVLEKLVRLKLLDDSQLLQSRIEALRRSGHSNRKICDKLRQSQFDYTHIKQHLTLEVEGNSEDSDAEIKDAETLAAEIKIQKTLQSYRRKYPKSLSTDTPDKIPSWKSYATDKMLRAGFSYDLIKGLLGRHTLD